MRGPCKNLPVYIAYRPWLVSGVLWSNPSRGLWYCVFLRCKFPTWWSWQPSDENECRQMLYTGLISSITRGRAPKSARLSHRRWTECKNDIIAHRQEPHYQKVAKKSANNELLALLLPFAWSCRWAKSNATVIVMPLWVKPLDNRIIEQLAQGIKTVYSVTLEMGRLMGGARKWSAEFCYEYQTSMQGIASRSAG